VEGDIGVGMRLRRMRGYEHAKPCDRCHCLTSWDLIELVVEVTHGQMLRQS
jgi:hypothetical protein